MPPASTLVTIARIDSTSSALMVLSAPNTPFVIASASFSAICAAVMTVVPPGPSSGLRKSRNMSALGTGSPAAVTAFWKSPNESGDCARSTPAALAASASLALELVSTCVVTLPPAFSVTLTFGVWTPTDRLPPAPTSTASGDGAACTAATAASAKTAKAVVNFISEQRETWMNVWKDR
ncbi:hypothetical protein GQ42DRAFT_72340 [Ramicandelaber brevisporus]|nr:hypothetical protein GQ42DRAFT_72340 [Ramicandelaber brevisporus]